MTTQPESPATDVIFAVDGLTEFFKHPTTSDMTVGAFAKEAASVAGAEDITDVFLEDAEDPLPPADLLTPHLASRFAPLQLAKRGKIEVTVEYQGQSRHRPFSPSVTLLTVIAWAISPAAFNLEGTSSDFQLKIDSGDPLSSDLHLGQVAKGARAVTFSLVFKQKPQG